MREVNIARDLDILLKYRRIKAVEPQVGFDLFGKNGTKIFLHIVDFIVTCNDGVKKAVEARGEETDIWKAKMKLWFFGDRCPSPPHFVAILRKSGSPLQIEANKVAIVTDEQKQREHQEIEESINPSDIPF